MNMSMDVGSAANVNANGPGRGRDTLRGERNRETSERERALFERRVQEVLGRLEQLMAAGPSSGSVSGRESLDQEIESLRLVLARLLAEEADPARLATSIPRVVDAVVRAIRAQRTLNGALAEGFTEALTQVLLELGLDEPR
jgi:hypothetical protein